MLNKSKNSNQKGFTIIEVMIVLAIAGLIMVVVFLAVPALQRAGRNNSLSTDSNNVLTAVSNYVSNNNGTLPDTATLSGTTATISLKAGGTNTETSTVDNGVAALGLIGASGTPISTTSKTPTPKGTIQVVTGANAQCNPTASGLVTGGGSNRSYVVLYVAESGSGNIVKCIGG